MDVRQDFMGQKTMGKKSLTTSYLVIWQTKFLLNVRI